jgi:GTP-binding protein
LYLCGLSDPRLTLGFLLTENCPLPTAHFSSDAPGNALHWKIALRAAALIVRPAQKFMPDLLPSLVIIGRPNVGKSTLFNRLTGTRRSIVTNEPGITRDRIYGKAEWRGRALEIVDTGGIVPDDKALIPQEILRQAHVAIKKAALIVLVVDSQAGLTPLDEELARLLRTTGKPFVIAVNKVDAMSQESNAAIFHRIGVPVFPIAAEHGTGVDDLLDAALAKCYPGSSEDSVVGAQHAAPHSPRPKKNATPCPFFLDICIPFW